MGKSQIIKRIHNAAKNYKQHFVGNTFMFVYEGRYVEVIFKKNCFLHLTGVNTNLRADDFYIWNWNYESGICNLSWR